jgi:hypothetical protein
MRRNLDFPAGLLGAMLVVGVALGQMRPADGAERPRPVNTFGSTETYYRISYSQFTTEQGVAYNDTGPLGAYIRRYTVGSGQLVSALQLPAGAIIDYAELDSC